MEKIYEVSRAGQMLSVYDECVSFAPVGGLGVLTKGLQGERFLYFKDISSIQWKKSSALLSGFIEFTLKGQPHDKQGGGLFAGTENPNRFTFWNRDLPVMEQIYDFCMKKLNSDSVSTAPSSSYNNLRELKSLLDDGIITQEEFDKKKTEILK